MVAQRVKHLPIIRETRVQSLGWDDLLEKEMATHFSVLAWKTPWTEEPGRLQSMGSQRVGHNWATSLSLSFMGFVKNVGVSRGRIEWGWLEITLSWVVSTFMVTILSTSMDKTKFFYSKAKNHMNQNNKIYVSNTNKLVTEHWYQTKTF